MHLWHESHRELHQHAASQQRAEYLSEFS
jgi:hypothetical protein